MFLRSTTFILGYLLSIALSQNANPQNPPPFAALDVLRGRGPYNAAEVLNLILNARPGTSYPNLAQIPQNLAFSCAQAPQPGYYANVDTGCQIYHRCEPNNPTYTFMCPISTVFNQITLTCDYWYNVRCANSAQFYSYSNPRIYMGANVRFLDDGSGGSSSGSGSSGQLVAFGGGGSSGSGSSFGSGGSSGGGSGSSFGGGGSGGSGSSFGSGGGAGGSGSSFGGGGSSGSGSSFGSGGGSGSSFGGGSGSSGFGTSGGSGSSGFGGSGTSSGFGSFGGSGSSGSGTSGQLVATGNAPGSFVFSSTGLQGSAGGGSSGSGAQVAYQPAGGSYRSLLPQQLNPKHAPSMFQLAQPDLLTSASEVQTNVLDDQDSSEEEQVVNDFPQQQSLLTVSNVTQTNSPRISG